MRIRHGSFSPSLSMPYSRWLKPVAFRSGMDNTFNKNRKIRRGRTGLLCLPTGHARTSSYAFSFIFIFICPHYHSSAFCPFVHKPFPRVLLCPFFSGSLPRHSFLCPLPGSLNVSGRIFRAFSLDDIVVISICHGIILFQHIRVQHPAQENCVC